MNKNVLRKRLMATTLLIGMGWTIWSSAALAQDAAEQPVVISEEDEGEDEENQLERVVVTGSRIQRSTFDSIKPLQTLDIQERREVGLIDTIEILQTNEAAAGTQIDSSFSGFVTDNGPGSETINLRGLGANRTLVLLNGRRLAPLGVEGAPTQASINSIPSILLQRVDLLLDGSSSVYGSDAVAGVVNAVIDKNFTGFDVQLSSEIAEQVGSTDYTVATRFGTDFADGRGHVLIGAEFDRRAGVTIGSRDFFADCTTFREIDENGVIRTANVENEVSQELFNGLMANPLDVGNPCVAAPLTSQFIELSPAIPFGGIFAIPPDSGITQSIVGIPGFTDPVVFFPFDADGDRVVDLSVRQFARNGINNSRLIISPQERVNVFVAGEYELPGERNITPFGEILYTRIEGRSDSGSTGLFPNVGLDNPFNPCGVNGVDCGSSAAGPNGLFSSPSFIMDFNTFFRDVDPNRDGLTDDARICATFGATTADTDGDPTTPPVLVPGTGPFDNAACTPGLFGFGAPAGPIDVIANISIDGDRDQAETRLQQVRLVGGVRMDLPALTFDAPGLFEFGDWNAEVSASYNISDGISARRGIRDDRLNFALGNAVTDIDFDGDGVIDVQEDDPIPGQAPCVVPMGQMLDADVTSGCVPVNVFAPGATQVFGQFSPEEAAFLFDTRDFDTEFEQTIVNLFAAGKFANLPGGEAYASFGFEYRRDEIRSIPDNVASEGLFFGFFSDQGAVGSRDVFEVFGEVSLPLVKDIPFVDSLHIDASGRVLDDEFFGTEGVYSLSGGWRPHESLLLRATYGTSFRAPNLRELFLLPQSGFVNVADPCIAPAGAFVPDLTNPTGPAVFDPQLDTREQFVIDRCIAEGLPQDLGDGVTTANPNIQVFNQGNLNLDPENSESFTVGASFRQPFTDAFDLNLGVSYYDISVRGTVIEPGAGFLVANCFSLPQGDQNFCSNIRRDANMLIDEVDLGFLNLNEETVRGIDFNGRVAKDLTVFGQNFLFDLDVRASHLLERNTLFIGDDGEEFEGIFQGEFGFAKWQGQATGRIGWGDLSFAWFTRFVDSQRNNVFTPEELMDPDFVEPNQLGNAFGNASGADGLANGVFRQTCLGPALGDVNCRNVDFTTDYFVHNVSVTYRNDVHDFNVTLGINNVLDTEPPLIDPAGGAAQVSNVPLGLGFNTNGRTFVVQLRKGF